MTARRPSPSRLRSWAWLVVLLLVVAGAACGNGDDDSDPSAADTSSTAPADQTSATEPVSGEIVVLAAASLTESFTELKEAFEAANPDATVTISFDSSSGLAAQANEGAPADVYASADEANMKRVTDTGTATDPRTFTRNRLAILVGKGNPEGITGLADFPDVIYVLCAEGVPCGTYGDQALRKAGVDIAAHPPKSREANVKAVVTRITTGEADAGIVYQTDAKAAAGGAGSVEIPDEHNVSASYPIATLKQAPNPGGAAAFITFVLSAAGQEILAKYGFVGIA